MSSNSHPGASPYTRANVRQGILHYLLGRGMSGISGFVSIILLVRYMEVSVFAAYTTLIGLIMMVGILSSLGLERAATRYVPEGRLKHSAALLARFVWVTSAARLAIAALLTGMLGILWPFLGVSVFDRVPIGDFSWAIACYLIASTLFQYLSVVMQALVQQKVLTRILVIQWGGRLLLILALVASYSRITLDQALWIMALPEMVGVVVLALAVRRYLMKLHHHQHESPNITGATWPVWRDVRQMALHNHGYNLLTAPPQGYFMRMLAAAFLPVPFVAAYGFFLSLVERARPYLPMQLMYGMAEPVLIAGFVKDNDFDKLCSRTRFLFKANLLLLAPVLVWLAAVGPEFTSLMTGGKYVEYAWLLFLMVGQIVVGSHAVTSQLILNAVGQSHILLKSGIVSLLAMAAALAIAVLSDHWIYMVFTPLVYSIANNAFIALALRRRGYAYTLPWVDMAKIAASAVVAYVAVLLAIVMTHSPLGEVFVAVGTGLVVFLLALWLLGAVDIEDRKIVRSMFHGGARA